MTWICTALAKGGMMVAKEMPQSSSFVYWAGCSEDNKRQARVRQKVQSENINSCRLSRARVVVTLIVKIQNRNGVILYEVYGITREISLLTGDLPPKASPVSLHLKGSGGSCSSKSSQDLVFITQEMGFLRSSSIFLVGAFDMIYAGCWM